MQFIPHLTNLEPAMGDVWGLAENDWSWPESIWGFLPNAPCLSAWLVGVMGKRQAANMASTPGKLRIRSVLGTPLTMSFIVILWACPQLCSIKETKQVRCFAGSKETNHLHINILIFEYIWMNAYSGNLRIISPANSSIAHCSRYASKTKQAGIGPTNHRITCCGLYSQGEYMWIHHAERWVSVTNVWATVHSNFPECLFPSVFPRVL